jgi:hypothetical protein
MNFKFCKNLKLDINVEYTIFYTEMVKKFSTVNDILPNIAFSNETMFHLLQMS